VVSESQTNNGSDDPRHATLYGPAATPFTEKVRRGLLYKGVPFDLVEPSSEEDYRRWSPESGLLPVLEINGERHPDSTDILFKLDEMFPEPPLLSPDPRIRGQQTQLEHWADENLLFYFNRWMSSRDQNADDRQGEPGTAGSLRRVLAWLRAGGTWERPETAVLRGIGDRLDDLIGFLGTRPFFYSNSISMADLGAYSMLYTLSLGVIPGSELLVLNRPVLIDFMRRVEQATERDGDAQ
jgi:glutathione S-transferase